MSSPSFRRVRILSAAIALGALAACGDSSPPPPPPPAPMPSDLAVTVAAPTSVIVPGKKTAWVVTITNTGAFPAEGAAITNVVDTNSTITAVRCSGSAGGRCPQVVAASMTIGQIVAGGSLSLEIEAVVTAGTNGVVFESAHVSAANDTNTANDAQTATSTVTSNAVSVSDVPAAPVVGAGTLTVFTATVANAGPGVAQDLTISDQTVDAAGNVLKVEDITCTATGGATCPDTGAGFPLAVPTLPVGGALGLAISVKLPDALRGTITNTVGVKVDNDETPSDNTAVATTVVTNPLNGAYQAYDSDGAIYTMTIDADALTWAMVGDGFDTSGALTVDGTKGVYRISPNQSFDTSSPDLLVGAFDFGAGPRAFVAARAFALSTDEIGTAPFTVFGRQLGASSALTTIDSVGFDATQTLTDCAAATQVFRVSACPTPLLASYALTFSGPDITATDAVSGTALHLRVAKSGTSLILLRAEADAACNCRRFGVGVTDNSSALAGDFTGANTVGASGTLKLTDTSYAASWVSATGTASTDTATIAVQGTSAPVGLRGGIRASDGSFIYVVQTAPLALVVGAYNSVAAGTMEIWTQK